MRIFAASLAALMLAGASNSALAAEPQTVFVAGTGAAASAYSDVGEDPVLDEQTAFEAEDRDSAAEMNEMADRLADPDMQDGIAQVAENMTEAMMRLPVGKFVNAIEDARPGTIDDRIDENATVADLAGRDADRLPETVGRASREAVGMMSGFARAFATMMPEFETMARDMEEAMAKVRLPRR